MKKLWMVFALLTAAAFAPLSAQGQLAGKWAVELGEWQSDDGRQIRMPGGNTGTLEITVKGDSATAIWTTDASGAQPMTLRGKLDSKKAVLKGSREARRNINGEESTVTLNIVFDVSTEANALTGVLRMGAGDEMAAWRSVKGKRPS